MPRVKNKRIDTPEKGDVYIGRPSIFGNPFSHLPNTTAAYKVAQEKKQ